VGGWFFWPGLAERRGERTGAVAKTRGRIKKGERVWSPKAPSAHRVIAVAKRKVREAESEADPGPASKGLTAHQRKKERRSYLPINWTIHEYSPDEQTMVQYNKQGEKASERTQP
jgi:hypothetical protein